MNRAATAIASALACAAAITLIAPASAQAATGDRRCISRAEFHSVNAHTIAQYERRWGVVGLGRESKSLFLVGVTEIEYPRCGYRLADATYGLAVDTKTRDVVSIVNTVY